MPKSLTTRVLVVAPFDALPPLPLQFPIEDCEYAGLVIAEMAKPARETFTKLRLFCTETGPLTIVYLELAKRFERI